MNQREERRRVHRIRLAQKARRRNQGTVETAATRSILPEESKRSRLRFIIFAAAAVIVFSLSLLSFTEQGENWLNLVGMNLSIVFVGMASWNLAKWRTTKLSIATAQT